MEHAVAYGAQQDLSDVVRTHLFIISPNNSGSTFLRRSFEFSDKVWWLPREGQHMPGFPGPFTRDTRDALIWNATPDRRDRYLGAAYDWDKARQLWYFLARARKTDASVFVTSSPPFLLQMASLQRAFCGARFILMTRDPYAVAEGILRRPIERIARGEDKYSLVTRHIGECFRRQIANSVNFADTSLRMPYEELTGSPQQSAARIRAFLPQLEDYSLDNAVAVKGAYHETARNMNSDAFARLTGEVIDRLRAGFAEYTSEIEALGYAPTGQFK